MLQATKPESSDGNEWNQQHSTVLGNTDLWKYREINHTQSGQKLQAGAYLVAQILYICLPMQETQIWSLVREGTEACASRAHALQQEKPPWWEAHAPQQRPSTAKHKERKKLQESELLWTQAWSKWGKKETCYLMMETCSHLYRLGPINTLCDNTGEVGRNLDRAHLSQQDGESVSN